MRNPLTVAVLLALGGAAHATQTDSPDPSPSVRGVTAPERAVQIRSVDFQTGVIELFNFGVSPLALDGWRFCTHDFNQSRVYTGPNGFTGVTVGAGASVFVHVNNDAPTGDASRVNASSLGGGFASPLGTGAYALQLFFPGANGSVSFGNSSLIADHIQWNIAGAGVGSTEFRTSQAVSQSPWSAIGDFVATDANTASIVLTDGSGDIFGSPAEYTIVGPPLFDESIDGDASDDPNAPTPLALAVGGNTVSGEVNRSNDTTNGDRDFFTVTVPAGAAITAIDLLEWTPNNTGFIAVNEGPTGFVPSGTANADFLAGILVSTGNEGDNLVDNFQDQAVTLNSLQSDRLGPGTYTFVVQQTSDLTQSYSLNFVLEELARGVQVRSVDFTTGVIELFNFNSLDADLSRWRFCTHDFNEQRRYTSASGLDGNTVEAQTPFFIHFNNDAPAGDPDRINRSDLGGAFASPLDTDAYAVQLFFPDANGNVSFGNSSLIADHLQWNTDGAGAGSAEARTAQAVSQGLWTGTGDFIATAANSDSLALLDTTGGQAHGPDDYDVDTPSVNNCVANFDGDSDVDLGDFGVFGAAFGSNDGDINFNPAADFDEDGDVDLGDFGTFGAEFGRSDC